MDVMTMLPRNRSRAERVRRQARHKGAALSRRARREASAHPRAVAAGAVGVVGVCAAAIAKARSRNGGQRVHTTPQEGHPAGTGERSDRDIGGPTSPEVPNGGATGGAPGTPPDAGFEPHR